MSTEPPREPSREDTFGHRHGVTIMTVVLFGLLALVTVIQVAC